MQRMILACLLIGACVSNSDDDKPTEPDLSTTTSAICSEGGTEFPTSPEPIFKFEVNVSRDNGGTFDHCWLSGQIWHCEHWHSCKTASGCCTNKWLVTNCIKGPNTQCINCQTGCDCQEN